MRASTLTNAATISVLLAGLAACDGSGAETAGVGGEGGNAGTNGGTTGGTGGTGGSAGGADANADWLAPGDGSGGGATEGGAKDGTEEADGDAEGGPGGSLGDAEGGPGGSTGDAEGGVIDMCTTPLAGTTPFGAELFATVSFPYEGGTLTRPVNAQVYFPAGRLPGAAVILVGGYVGPGPIGPTVARSTLDSMGSVGALSVTDACGNGIAGGSLAQPSSGLTATAILNTDPFMSDALMLVQAPARLCPKGAVPDAAVVSAPMEISPTARIALSLTTPVDLATRASIKIKDSNRTLAVTGGEAHSILYVTPQTGAFAPGDLTLDVAGLTDVLGRSYSQLVTLKVQKPTTVIADRTLTTPPSSTTWVTSGVSVTGRDGLLAIEPSPFPPFATQYAVTIGLGNELGSKTLRIKHRWVCASPSSPPKSIKLLAGDGTVVDVTGNCVGASEDTTITLAGTGPFFLVVQNGWEQSSRCSFPTSPARDGWELDEFAFAP